MKSHLVEKSDKIFEEPFKCPVCHGWYKTGYRFWSESLEWDALNVVTYPSKTYVYVCSENCATTRLIQGLKK